ncbi:MAG: GH36 C-terminal domain-containing protein [Pirellulaceae bacterium]
MFLQLGKPILDRQESGEGIVVVLKRPGSLETTQSLRLENFDPAKSYQISNLDSGQQETVTGSTLNQPGLRVQLQRQPDSAVLHYKTCE